MHIGNIAKANGIPFAFDKYEVFKNGNWKNVVDGIQTNKDSIRLLQSDTETA